MTTRTHDELIRAAELQATPEDRPSTYAQGDDDTALVDTWTWCGITQSDYAMLRVLVARRVHGNAGTINGTGQSARQYVRAGIRASGMAQPQHDAMNDAVSEAVLILAHYATESWDDLASAVERDEPNAERALRAYMSRAEVCARIHDERGAESVTRYLVACAARDGVRRTTVGHSAIKGTRDAAKHAARGQSYVPSGDGETYVRQDVSHVNMRGADLPKQEGSAPTYVSQSHAARGVIGAALDVNAKGTLVNPALAALALCDSAVGRAADALYGNHSATARLKVIERAHAEYAATIEHESVLDMRELVGV